MRLLAHNLIVLFLLVLFSLLFSQKSFAETTSYRSAAIITTDGATSYTNLANCSTTDGLTCNRVLGNSYGNLYFRDFGTYADFGISPGSKITKVKMRVTGKASSPLYVGVSAGITFTENCQWPTDLWPLFFSNQTIGVQNFATPVIDVFQPGAVRSYCFAQDLFDSKKFIWRINFSSGQSWSANIDNFELAFDYIPGATPTPTPSPTLPPISSPTPSGPEPFLDLPWDYEAKGLTFNEAANGMTSYFDHTYPILSAGMVEPNISLNQITTYQNENSTTKNYSSHDGYDYGRVAQASMGESVLAAASGWATYKGDCGACGEAILIDHGNGFQTRYYHLQTTELITKTGKVWVEKGQKIGLVGATGNVSPQGADGAHIHFGVFEDKNKDGNFEDNVPDGVIDPFGWQSKEPDPWETYSFFYNGKQRTGNKSYYLWKKKIDKLDATLTANQAVFKTSRFTADFPQGATNKPLTLQMIASPVVQISEFLSSVGSTITITARDALGNFITSFEKPFLLKGDYSTIDTSRYNIDTISFYSSSDGKSWTKELTTVDPITKTASTQLNHLTQFALVAQRLDTIPPITTAVLDGQQGSPHWFRSDVQVTLNAVDNEGGLGVDYTLYRLAGKEWEPYKEPLVFSTEGQHTIEYYSADKDENIEEIRSVIFNIDKTPPAVSIDATPKEIWPPNGKMVDVAVSGTTSDAHLYLTTTTVVDEYRRVEPIITSLYQTIQLEANRDGQDQDGRIYTLKRITEDLAGNKTVRELQIQVPHSQEKKK